MNQRRKHLANLLQTSHRFLEQPDSEEKWLDFQRALQVVEDIEKFEALAAQPENLKTPDEETRQLLRRYYENEVRPARRRFRPQVWSSLAAAVFVLIGCYLIFNLTPLPMMLSAIFSSPTPTATPSPTNAPTPIPTITPSPTATLTPSPTSTATSIPTATPSDTATTEPAPTVTASTTPRPSSTPKATITDTPRPTRTLTPVPSVTLTPMPQLTSQQLADHLTVDNPFRKYAFQANAGDMLTIQLDSQDFDPFVGLHYEDGSEVLTNDDCGSLRRACIGPIKLTQDGVYTITVDSFSRRETGAFSLDIAVTRANCTVEAPRVLIVSDNTTINLRSAPDQTSAIVGMIYTGECFAVIGRTSNGAWIKIRLGVYRDGWVLAALGEFQGDMETIPILTE